MDECEPLAAAVNRGCEKRPDGSYVILYGASAATADEWGRRYLKDVSCGAIAFEVRLISAACDTPHNAIHWRRDTPHIANQWRRDTLDNAKKWRRDTMIMLADVATFHWVTNTGVTCLPVMWVA
jgi:hypothetical protein